MLQDKDLVSIQEVRSKIEKAHAAWQKFRTYTQEQVDAIVEHMAAAARANARRLAELAVQETGMGNAQSKLVKNLLNADVLPRRMRGMKTVGVLRELPEDKIVEIGVPVGVVAAILPTTNPTSSAIFKTLICLKSGNAIVVSPHPRAKACTCETTAVLMRAAVEAGAPEDLIQCIYNATMEGTTELMKHKLTSVILATGGSGIVKAAYSSGKPAFGVGPGNVPVLIERTADVPDAVAKVVLGKSFDYGTVCSSEQAIVAEEVLRDQVIAELKKQKAYFCTPDQKAALAKILITQNWTINPDCVGQSPQKIAQMGGFSVPPETSILVVDDDGVGKKNPLSVEKLSPVLSLYFQKDFAACCDICYGLLKFGGLGHTSVIYSRDDGKIREYGLRMPSMRVLVNTPAPQGSTGITTNVFPSMTLGCGAAAGNITSDNVGPHHLMNIKRIAYVVRKAEDAFEFGLNPESAPQPALHAGPVDRNTIVAAVERYLSSRGIAVAASAGATGGGGSCGCNNSAPAPAPVTSSTVGNIAADIVDSFLARKAASKPSAPACGAT